jgi:2OG-Fe dioxygenase
MASSLLEPDREGQSIARKKLELDGYVLVRDRELGVLPHHRGHIHRAFFNDRFLRRYDNDIPADRLRARDVVRYDWSGDELELRRHETIAIENRGEHPGRREFDRAEVLDDRVMAHWIRGVLHLVPENLRQASGTFGVNFFRTFTNVVTRPHQDGEEYIVVYVVDKIGGGARTQLYGLDRDEVLVEDELGPGDLIIVRDDAFRHNATPLTPPREVPARRDALVCTVNYPHTYPISP